MVRTTSIGSRPIAVSPESITASVPSNTALATSLTSARVGEGAVIIDSSICVAVMTGVPVSTQCRMIRFWRCGHVLDRAVDAEVAAGDHDRVGRGDDVVQVVDRRVRLDLRHELSPVADDRPHLLDVARLAHERHRDVFDSGGRHRLGEDQVLLGGCGEPQASPTTGARPVARSRDHPSR